MIQVKVNTNTTRQIVNAEVTSTPASVLDELGVGTSGAFINLNGTIMSPTKLCSTFESLNVNDGERINLNVIVKADGALA